MKKIISTTFLFGMLLSGGMFSAQKMTQEKMKAIYSDDVATFKKQFAPGDYNKCFLVGNIAYSPLGFSVMSDRKNIINFLLDNKANVNKKCQNKTPLEVADDTKGTEEIKKILTEKGGNRN
ncbi:hypothetical protein [Chryseobacterium sp. GVT01B]|uniref:hypothetical protein n=1 Tax=Chryseobacterium sp. GVT01B TaxID=2862675 RepID=UPI001CBED3CB|nr:hypothetical protein [Chryseobacterium sp. GVT01B]